MTTRVLLVFFASLATPAWADSYPAEISPILKQYCLDCHGPDLAEGNLRVDQLTQDFSDRDNALAWIEVRNQINLGQMPPDGEPKPSVKWVESTSKWIAAGLREAERNRTSTDGRILLRRMNRHEYTNTIADLLAMKFPTGESPLDVLPPDGTAEGFDKVSTALLLDPSLMSHYYEVARRIADRAIVDGPPKFPTATMRLEYEEMADSVAIGYLVTRLGMKTVPGGLQLIEGSTRSFGMLRYPGRRDNNVAPVNGYYRFTIRAAAHPGADGTVPRLRLSHSHPDDNMRTIMEFDVKAPWDKPKEYTVVVPRDTLGGELNIRILNETKLYMGQRPGENFMRRNGEIGKQGNFAETLRLKGRKIAEGWGGDRSTPDPEKLDITQFPRVFLDYLEVEGPLYDQWPPKSHTTLLFRGEDAREDMEYAREIFRRFLPRAWRRPIREAEIEPILRVVKTELEHEETFHEAIRVGLAAALTSPKFLYLVEPQSTDARQFRELNDYEIASRLSYFLWSSMPDKELFKAAKAGDLTDPAKRTAQVDRMLADPKANRFVEGFARQWLRTETFLNFTPDQYLYREYDDRLADAVVQEPLEFFRTIMQNDLSALNFLDSDFLVINDRLAEHYGIEGVEGEEFRTVNLPANSRRGGLLAMAGVHQAGSDGIRTKPVSRAVYVREVLFNDPPDPPPPNAGEVEPNIKGERLTVRERLLQHQEIEACAACHRSLDPYGLALENFNVIGAWRESQDGENFRGNNRPTIDASGRLPNGTDFGNFEEFRQLLRSQDDRFRRALAEKLFVYALGRAIEPTDDPAISKAVSDLKANGDTFRSLIQSLVNSKAFVTK
ncbi:DUF1592 domain-containing protein [Thalassoroseus pseudoceratinae]|uniref:DUF1592 domain-containing protein n=1 Tax=Thalassoroseus pseudoceratinae TaxID=2713176 RepID=UPI00141E4AC7|nr:DUF1592 domain-containing protein [Thalassoroseus pseudoceratinae]